MSDLFKNVKQKVYHLNGVEASDIVNAEKKLGIRFDEEYRNYLNCWDWAVTVIWMWLRKHFGKGLLRVFRKTVI